MKKKISINVGKSPKRKFFYAPLNTRGGAFSLFGLTLTNRQAYKCLVIHEVCHALTPGWHGKEFQRRLLKARKRAKELGHAKLAQGIFNDWEEAPFLKADDDRAKKLLRLGRRKSR